MNIIQRFCDHIPVMVFAGGMAKRQAQRWQVAIRRWTQQAKRPGAGRESFI